MTYKYYIIAAFSAFSLSASAQQRQLSGVVLDKESKEALMQTTIQVLKSDSSYVAGAATDENGYFKVNVPADGKYIVKMTNIGYRNLFRNVTVTESKDVNLGNLSMEADAVLLKEVVANGMAAKLVVKEDTFIYNAAAYRTPEGSVVEELVKRLPGAQVDESGNITINGKQVKKIKVDGKEFMTGDTQTALKNLPTSIIEKVKAYDEKSDMAKLTGVDDGEENTILDFGIKRGMNKGFMSNIDLAYGTDSRYAERVMAGMMQDEHRLMGFGNANNTNDRGFGGRGGRGGGGNGLQANKMIGLNYNYEKTDKLRLNLSGRWNHSNTDNWNKTATESFVSKVGAFSNSQSQTYGRTDNWNFNGMLEWKPDTMWTIQLRPNFSMSSNDNMSKSVNASFSKDPYSYGSDIDPLDAEAMLDLRNKYPEDSLLINRNNNSNLSYSSSKNANIQGTVSRKLGSYGHSLTYQVRYAYSDSDSEQLGNNETNLYLVKNILGGDSTYYRRRYNLTPGDNWSLRNDLTFSLRVSKYSFLVMRYMYQYSDRTSNRSTYDFSRKDGFGDGVTPSYRNFGDYINPYLPLNSESPYYSDSLSRYSEYKNYTHEVELTWRRTTDNYNLNLGVMWQPQSQRLIYRYLAQDFDVKRDVSNVTPTLDFRYKFSKQKSLRLNYRGNTSQPSMTDMLPITDDSDPQNIRVGNPELKPSFTQNFSLRYNNYVQSHFTSVMAFVNYSNTSNSTANLVEYNELTAGRITKPVNIDGNWNVNSSFMFNTSIDTMGVWNVNSFTNVRYVNSVNYVFLNNKSEENYTRSTTLGERLGMSYRNSWIEVELNGNVDYSINKNKLQPNSNRETWDFQYGTDITVTAPWGTGFSTSAHMSSRRGYSTAEANTNEFIWNAQVSQSFLQGKPLTISLQFYDILKQKSSFSRSIDANSRRDQWYNSINSYAMLHVIYRFNAFGGKQARHGDRPDGPPMGMPPGNFRGGNGGGNRGGWGGGGPRGGFGGGGRF